MTMHSLISVLRPACVVATIAVAVLTVLCLWGWQLVDWSTYWKLFFSYCALMVASTTICYIDNPKNLIGRD